MRDQLLHKIARYEHHFTKLYGNVPVTLMIDGTVHLKVTFRLDPAPEKIDHPELVGATVREQDRIVLRCELLDLADDGRPFGLEGAVAGSGVHDAKKIEIIANVEQEYG